MSEYMLSSAFHKRIKNLFSELNSKSFESQNILKVNHYDIS